jgi:uncharacterized protein YfiM (DUF2279 family)
MKSLIAAVALVAIGSAAIPSDAYAIGCLSGAAVGGVAGHYAGHHGLLGAAAGCAVGHHEHVVQRRRAEEGAYSQQGYAQPAPYRQ